VSHRDIKLTNLLISTEGRCKLVDFGLAQFFSTVAKSDTEKVDRTVDYAGLERATNVKYGDVRSDIFFLGCVLFEMLAGRSPLDMTRDKYKRMHAQRFLNLQTLKPGDIKAPPSVYHLVDTMMALQPSQRYQTPTQLVEAVKAARRDIAGAAAGNAAPRSLFIVEKDPGLQEKMRERFKELGYRVLLSFDPVRALDRFRQQPYDALVVDAATVGDEGRLVFQQVLLEANSRKSPCVGVILFSQDQADEAARVTNGPTQQAFIQPVTFGQLKRALKLMLQARQ
jgi:serine/threonine protein kinase